MGTKAASTAVTAVTSIAQTAILANLLEPEDFGLVAMAGVITGVSSILSNGGIGAALIQRENVSQRELSSLYWFSVMAAATAYLAIWAATPLAIAYFGQAELRTVMPLAALSLLFTALGAQHESILRKNLAFTLLAKIEVASSVCGALIGIGCAFAGWGVYSLIALQVSGALLKSILLNIFCRPETRPRFQFAFSECRSYLRFGFFQTGERLVNYFAANIDYLIIARVLGPVALGYYAIAYKLVSIPLKRLNPIVTSVAFPVFALKQNDDRALRAGYLDMSRGVALISFPALTGITLVAPQLVPTLYGPGWEPSIPLLQALCVLGLLKSLGNPSGSILLAKGRADIGFTFNVVTLAINAVCFWLAVRHGVLALAYTFSGLTFVYFIALQGGVINRLIGLTWLAYLKALWPALLANGAMAAAVLGASQLALVRDRSLLAQMLGLAALGAAIYAAVALLVNRAYFLAALRSLRAGRKGVR